MTLEIFLNNLFPQKSQKCQAFLNERSPLNEANYEYANTITSDLLIPMSPPHIKKMKTTSSSGDRDSSPMLSNRNSSSPRQSMDSHALINTLNESLPCYDQDTFKKDSSICESDEESFRPPCDDTPEKQARFYWELCYGKTPQSNSGDNPLASVSWSASRNTPERSSLSTNHSSVTKKCTFCGYTSIIVYETTRPSVHTFI